MSGPLLRSISNITSTNYTVEPAVPDIAYYEYYDELAPFDADGYKIPPKSEEPIPKHKRGMTKRTMQPASKVRRKNAPALCGSSCIVKLAAPVNAVPAAVISGLCTVYS